MKKITFLFGGFLLALIAVWAQSPSPSVSNIRLQPGEEINLQIGKSRIQLKKDGSILIEGVNVQILAQRDIDVKASGASVLKGTKIKEN